MRLEEIFPIVDRVMAIKVNKNPSSPSIPQNEIEKKVDYILSNAQEKLVLNHENFLQVKGAFINRLLSIPYNDETQINRIRELRGGRTHRRRKLRRTRKYKK